MSSAAAHADVGVAAVPFRLSWTRALEHRLALPLVFVVAFAYHGLSSLGHVSPLVFDDELLYTKLAQSLAAGHGFEIWGHRYFFPAPLAPLVQAPVWLLFGTGGTGFLAIRILSAALMAAAAFPAYRLAARLLPREWALLTAAFTVAAPGLVYHDYLMAEFVAYPCFVLAVAAIVEAVADESHAARVLAPVACALAISARLQFVFLPVAYALAVALFSRRRRAHLVPLAALALPAAIAVALRGGGAIGQYESIIHWHLSPHPLVHWTLLVAMCVPFALGLAVVPGALLGLAARPRSRAEGAFVVVAVVTLLALFAQAGIWGANEAQRPMERYVIYAAPLVAVAFFLYADRGAPRRLLYATLAVSGGLAVARFPFDELVPRGNLYVDGTTATAFSYLASSLGPPNATLTIELLALAVGIACAVMRPSVPAFAATTMLIAIAVSLAGGVLYYRADHLTTAMARDSLAASSPWVDRPSTYVALPYDAVNANGTVLIWNSRITAAVRFHETVKTHLPWRSAGISKQGRLLIDGTPNRPGTYILGNWNSQIDVDSTVIRRHAWQTEVQLARGARVRWLAFGLTHDRTTLTDMTYLVFLDRPHPGRFVVTLSLPSDRLPKTIRASVHGGKATTVKLRRNGRVRFTLDVPRTKRPMLWLHTTVTGARYDAFSAGKGVRVNDVRFVRAR
jgi:Dolichyl-phosphate-mannose-protein mannosyltransferase